MSDDKLFSADRRRFGKDRRDFLEKSIAATGLFFFSPAFHFFERPRKDVGMRTDTGNSITSAALMAAAAGAFLNSLSGDQRAKATFVFNDEQRFDWHFIPRVRKGIPFKELSPEQRHLANALLGAGLGQRGFIKATSIMSLEAVLGEIEKGSGPVRDPELYYFSLFGEPQVKNVWGWRVEGHHISLNYTLVSDQQVATTPHFFGSNPAEVQHGPRKGLRVQAREEDLARALLKSLDDKQRSQAVVSESAPRDILSGNSRKADAIKPAGLQASKLGQRQADILMELLKEYAASMPPDIAAIRMDKLRAAGFGNVSFAWAGGPEYGQPHYYRLQGPTFLVEYDNIQNNANHIHTVWRDFNGDFGLDLLAMHYKNAHS